MSPKTFTPSPQQITWAEAHRCAICNSLPITVTTEIRTEIECENGHTFTGYHWKFLA